MKLRTLFTLCAIISTTVSPAIPYSAVGNWMGTLEAGAVRLRIVFHIKEDGSGLKATMDSPDQGVKDIPIAQIRQSDDSVSIMTGPITYEGRLTSDSTIEGIFTQGQEFPLVLHRTEFKSKDKPQTPRPPYPYSSEDVTYTNADKSVSFGATLTLPKDGKNHPAVLLISGSGQQNRDGEILGHKPFAVIADYLTRRGFAVLRVDDRGTGGTTGDLKLATTAFFAKDAATSLDYLKSRPGVDARKLCLIGHSEGGMIATMLAAERKDVAAIVSMAGPGVSNKDVLIGQNNALLEKKGISADARQAYLELYSNILNAAQQPNGEAIQPAIEQVTRDWVKKTPENLVKETADINDEASIKAFAKTFASQLSIPWYQYFIRYDPAASIKKISSKVLVLNGTEDIQVTPKENLRGWKAALAAGKTTNYEVKELHGLNHLFQECKTCDVSEYGTLEQTISPELLKTVGDWLTKELM